MSPLEVKVPDIGDFEDVPVIEIHVAVGDDVAPEDPLVTLESDKATMDIPAPSAGKVTDLRVALEDRVSEGSLILVLDAVDGAPAPSDQPEPEVVSEPARPASSYEGEVDQTTQVVVIGSGPGGYAAAFRAADLGLQTTLVERYDVARRRLPERRLHPVQGAAARGEGRRGDGGDGRARHLVRRAADRPRRRSARGRTPWSGG